MPGRGLERRSERAERQVDLCLGHHERRHPPQVGAVGARVHEDQLALVQTVRLDGGDTRLHRRTRCRP